MTVDYIHFRLPYSEMALLGNVPTFFYFGITLLPLKKKVLQTSRHRSDFNAWMLVFCKEQQTHLVGEKEI